VFQCVLIITADSLITDTMDAGVRVMFVCMAVPDCMLVSSLQCDLSRSQKWTKV